MASSTGVNRAGTAARGKVRRHGPTPVPEAPHSTSPVEPVEDMVEDASEREDEEVEAPVKYDISSYGADLPVDGLVRRMGNEDIYVPPFQRRFVWRLPQASRFVESLLLGLPVPGVFLSKDPETQKLLVVDGQQRLQTLKRFYDGIFEGREFGLVGVQQQFVGRTYKQLQPEDRRRLDDAIIHATIIRQERPTGDMSSVYHIFNRLNTGGTPLNRQEIRACVSHGAFIDLLGALGNEPRWRELYGSEKPSARQKDQELILRFLALHFALADYSKPMHDFLDLFVTRNRGLGVHSEAAVREAFTPTVAALAQHVGRRAFRPQRALNAAVCDAVMVGTSRRLAAGPVNDPSGLAPLIERLFGEARFLDCCSSGTTDKDRVEGRIGIAAKVLGELR
jgi:hypothetical protein